MLLQFQLVSGSAFVAIDNLHVVSNNDMLLHFVPTDQLVFENFESLHLSPNIWSNFSSAQILSSCSYRSS